MDSGLSHLVDYSTARAWLAGFTRRWHMHPKMANTNDRVDGHSSRVAVLVLKLDPDASANLLKACIVHDLGEHAVGDIAYPAKKKRPELREMTEALEAEVLEELGLSMPDLTKEEKNLLHFADRMDALLWAMHHEKEMVMTHDAWLDHLSAVRGMADAMGFLEEFESLTEGVAYGTF